RRRHTRLQGDWSSDVCSSDLPLIGAKKRTLTDRKFEATPQRLVRGKYLVDGVNGCFGCHTDADWSKHGAPPVAGREGSGHVWSEIGRASCRERVEISVGAVVL